MKLVLQRVKEASVRVGNETIASIGFGLLVFLCVEKGDSDHIAAHYASKIADLRIFEDAEGKMNLSAREVRGEVLLVSQFTLAANAEKGRRPSFDQAAPPETAKRLYEYFAEQLRKSGISVVTGRFQTMMQVGLINDGPVTILLGNR